MESIRLTGTALQATVRGCTLSLRVDRDGSKTGTVYNINGELELLERLQKVQAGFMEIVGEELDLFEFDHFNDQVVLRLRTTTGHSIDTVMDDVVKHVPLVAPVR